jgi:hypothetical protein
MRHGDVAQHHVWLELGYKSKCNNTVVGFRDDELIDQRSTALSSCA